MQTPSLDLLILNATCDDWENLSSIRSDVSSASPCAPVHGAALESRILRLVQAGLLTAHEFRDGAFVPLPPSAVSPASVPRLWYFISPADRRLLGGNESFFETADGWVD